MVYQSLNQGIGQGVREGKPIQESFCIPFCILDPVAIVLRGTTTLELAEGMLLRGKNDKIYDGVTTLGMDALNLLRTAHQLFSVIVG